MFQVLLATGAYDAAATDVWAAGVVLFQMLTSRMPFCHDANASGILDRAMMQRIVRGQCVFPLHSVPLLHLPLTPVACKDLCMALQALASIRLPVPFALHAILKAYPDQISLLSVANLLSK